MALGRFVKGGAYHFRVLDRAFHVRHFLRTFVNEEDDKINVRVVGINGIGKGLQDHGFAGARRGHDKAALTAADGGHKINDAPGVVVLPRFHLELPQRVYGGKVVEKNQIFRAFRRLKAYLSHAQQGEVAFPFLGGAYVPGNHIALAQSESANLGRGDVYVVRSGHIAVHGGAQKTESVREYFQHAVARYGSVLRRTALEQGENQFLLAKVAGVLHLVLVRQLHEFGSGLELKLRKIESAFAVHISGNHHIQIGVIIHVRLTVLVLGRFGLGVALVGRGGLFAFSLSRLGLSARALCGLLPVFINVFLCSHKDSDALEGDVSDVCAHAKQNGILPA